MPPALISPTIMIYLLYFEQQIISRLINLFTPVTVAHRCGGYYAGGMGAAYQSVTAVTEVIGVSGATEVIGDLRRVVPEGGAVRASVGLPSLTRADHVCWLTIRERTDPSQGKGQFVRSAGRSVIAR